jgi:hypothetical protein
MRKYSYIVVFILGLKALLPAYSQNDALIKGMLTDENKLPVIGANVIDLTNKNGTITSTTGFFQLKIPALTDVTIEISYLGYNKLVFTLNLNPGQVLEINRQLEPSTEMINEVIIESKFEKASSLERINIKSIDHIPTPSGGIEKMLITLGASARNEMSTQYSVRGGNFDENLVYINDIEIYRPLTIRSGQQEGLSIINSAMVSSVQFSAGGFEAQYGDKMSSVLDIKYKRPSEFMGSASASLLGASIHFEGASHNRRFTHISGLRYKTNQYLLNSLQTKGDYKPRYFDFQSFLTWDITKKIEMNFLGNVALNYYTVIPQTRETAFGTYQNPLNLVIFYEGQEKDRFENYLGALTLSYQPNTKLNLKIIGSFFNTNEVIRYDILGQYWINLLDNTTGSETANDSILNIGVGTNLQHARNYLSAYVYNISHKGSFYTQQYNLKWGISWQRERIFDRIREWEMIDSAGYSVPNSDEIIEMYHFSASRNRLMSNRLSGFCQTAANFNTPHAGIFFTGGLRFQYWDVNGQLLISPRMRIMVDPYWKKSVTFHLAAGLYYQPPFYKEMIDPDGKLHDNLPAQQSIHYLIGTSYTFALWDRPFKFSSELYYKHLSHLIPYKTEDVAIQYLPEFHARGYVVGIEFKINGEFVKDAESWASMSIMKAMEDVYNDYYINTDKTVVYPGYYRRPTDQLVNFGIYFQDYFPNNPDYKVHVTMFYGSRIPFSSPDYNRPSENYEMKAYKRIDIGISKSIYNKQRNPNKLINKAIKDAWINIEVFNLFGFKNPASYQWVRTVSNQEGMPNVFAVPNYLTGRIVNFRISAQF